MNRIKRPMSREKRLIRTGIIAAVLFTGAGGCAVLAYDALNPESDVTFTVSGKERVCDGGKNGSCKYLIYTDHGTYENTDSLLKGKFNSSDMYGSICVGTKYTAHVRGVRAPFLSWYKNIIEIRPA